MILVTGGSGLVGEVLIRKLLDQGKQVSALVHSTSLSLSHQNLREIHCDILDMGGLEDALHGIEQVYHCAGVISFYPSQQQQMFKVNVEGTANLVNACLAAKVKKMLHISSIAALERLNEENMIDESAQWSEDSGGSQYGYSKFLGEMEVWRGIEEGLNAVIVNPSIILGAGDWDNASTKIFKTVKKGFKWYSDGTTGFVDVRDLVDAMIKLMNSEVSGKRFIISEGNHSYREIFNMIADGFNVQRPSKKVSTLMSDIIWRMESIRSKFTGSRPLITKETARAAHARVQFDNSRLLQQFPDFQYRPMEETIKDVCRMLLETPFGKK